MRLQELYDRTPAEKHGEIVVAGNRVYLRAAEGTEEYALLPDGELTLVRSDRFSPLATIQRDLSAIKSKLGI